MMPDTTILIVEDEVIVAAHQKKMLIEWGYNVLPIATTGQDAIQMVESLSPDLVLMDINLQGEMDGIQAAEYIYSCLQVPVVFVTAHADEEILQRAKITEPFGYVLKPFVKGELRVNIELALYKHHMAQRLSESEEKFRSIFEQSTDAIILCDEQGKIIAWNQATENLTGLNQEDVVGQFIWEIQYITLPDDKRHDSSYDRLHSRILQVLQTGDMPWSDKLEGEIRHLDGTSRHIQQVIFTIQTSKGFMLGSITHDITERVQIEKRLEYLATHDALTELPNRALFYDRLEHALANARRNARHVGVLYLDLDGFKSVNDTFGHEGGDDLLSEVANRLSNCLRESDTVARLGGDEFTFCLENIQHAADAAIVAKKIFASIAEPFKVAGHEVLITASMGICLYPKDGLNVQELLRNADAAMYAVKNAGKNGYQFYKSGEQERAVFKE
jgi:diguanylate cyclase (GGDEF)-like protein/PAS domain S-box-containing protein